MPDKGMKFLEEELILAQKIDINIKADTKINPLQKLVDAKAVKKSLYTQPEKMEDLISELEGYIDAYAKNGSKQGKILAKNSLDTFLDKSEAAVIKQKRLGRVLRMTDKQAKQRLKLAKLELSKEAGILKKDIQLYFKNARLTGMTTKDILKNLITAGADKAGMVQGFAKRAKSLMVNVVRRERSASEIAEYKAMYPNPKEKWQWVTVSSKPCPDCQARAGKVMLYARWVKMGIPGAGMTICGSACKCKLKPLPISEAQFPKVKEFKWNSKDLVLTTAGQSRSLKAKTNQPPKGETKIVKPKKGKKK